MSEKVKPPRNEHSLDSIPILSDNFLNCVTWIFPCYRDKKKNWLLRDDIFSRKRFWIDCPAWVANFELSRLKNLNLKRSLGALVSEYFIPRRLTCVRLFRVCYLCFAYTSLFQLLHITSSNYLESLQFQTMNSVDTTKFLIKDQKKIFSCLQVFHVLCHLLNLNQTVLSTLLNNN